MNILEGSGCAVLAGGAGRRMGQLNKAELELDGQTFLARICEEFEKAGMKGYVSIASYEQRLPEGWTRVMDSVTDPGGGFTGPAGGILSCLEKAKKDGLSGLFFSPCDTPFFSRAVVYAAAEAAAAGDACDACIPRTGDGRLQAAFGWYSTGCIRVFSEEIAAGNYRLTGILQKLRLRVFSTAEAGLDDDLFMNVNHMDAYRRIRDPLRRTLDNDEGSS